MWPPFHPATWTGCGLILPGYDACGCVFGVIRQPFRARFRFYVGDTRETWIEWTRAPEGAALYEGQTPIHPFRDHFTMDPLGPGEVGELDDPPRVYGNFLHGLGAAGVAPDATEEELAGLAPVPDGLLPDGTMPPELLPGCAHPPGVALAAHAGETPASIGLGAFTGTPRDAPASAGLALGGSCFLPSRYQSRAGIALQARSRETAIGGVMVGGLGVARTYRTGRVRTGGGMAGGVKVWPKSGSLGPCSDPITRLLILTVAGTSAGDGTYPLLFVDALTGFGFSGHFGVCLSGTPKGITFKWNNFLTRWELRIGTTSLLVRLFTLFDDDCSAWPPTFTHSGSSCMGTGGGTMAISLPVPGVDYGL